MLQETVKDYSPTAYFASLAAMYNQQANTLNQEALAYSFSAVISMLDIAVIQNQHAVIFDIVTRYMLAPAIESPQVGKYGLVALQFLLHSKTEAEWNNPADSETERAFSLLLQSLIDSKREKV